MDFPPPRPRPFAEFPEAPARRLRGVLTDIDDTLTTRGALTADALAALGALRAAGVPVVAVTGRPAGWSEPFARDWPIDAIVAENGAVALHRVPGGDVAVDFAQPAGERERNARRLREVAARVLAEVPGATLAADSAGRLTDIAVDHAEHATLDAARIAQVVALMRGAGMQATVSSIHVNGWFGAHDKFSGARWIVRKLYGLDLGDAAEADRWLCVGDSPNDQPMFERFAASVGVANLMQWADAMTVWPAYLTEGARGAGFAEVARRVLAARRAAAGAS